MLLRSVPGQVEPKSKALRYEPSERHSRRASTGTPDTMCELSEHRARRENRRLCAAVRQAALHATPGELVDLERMIVLVRNGNLTNDEAVRTCATIRRNADRDAA